MRQETNGIASEFTEKIIMNILIRLHPNNVIVNHLNMQ